MHGYQLTCKHLQVHTPAATSLPAVLDGPAGAGELVPGVSGSVCGGKGICIIVDKVCY